MFVYVFTKPTYQTSDVTTFAESAVYILHVFANNFGTKRDSLLQCTANQLNFSCSFT